ncbi:MAG: hypothetical protein VX154_06220 [Pseudomonadota bacterium]|nr:hypothetical protein [Pseudomonadota bacterium]
MAEIAFPEKRRKFSKFPDILNYLPTFEIWMTGETVQNGGVGVIGV